MLDIALKGLFFFFGIIIPIACFLIGLLAGFLIWA